MEMPAPIGSAGEAGKRVPSTLRWPTRPGAWLALAAVAAVGVAARVLFARDLPLWFDETFTAVIASQPTPAALVRWCLSELTGPAFYMPMWLWVRLAGASDGALRLPGFVMSIAAPALLAWRGHPDRGIRFLWATLAFLSMPMIIVATEARPYPQLFLLGCLQAIAFLAAMRTPTMRRAFAWTGVTALLILTHYHSLMIGGIEGLILLAMHRRRALRCWPALLVFVPVVLWATVHAGFMLTYARTLTATASPNPWQAVVFTPVSLLGLDPLLGLVILATVTGSGLAALRGPAMRAHGAVARSDRALALAGLLTLALAIGMGLVRPGFSVRYLVPVLPALLFALALWAKVTLTRQPLAVLVAGTCFLVSFASMLRGGVIDGHYAMRQVLSFEPASDWLMQQHPQRLVFLWQSPNASLGSVDHLREFAGFFFARAGQPVDIAWVRPAPGDANPLLAATAQRSDATAILWLRDPNAFPGARPAIASRYPGWECRDFGADAIAIYACRRPTNKYVDMSTTRH